MTQIEQNMTGQIVGHADTMPLPERYELSGHLAPVVGRVARRDVAGYFGFPIVKAGQIVTPSIAEKAQSMGRLFELISATEEA